MPATMKPATTPRPPRTTEPKPPRPVKPSALRVPPPPRPPKLPEPKPPRPVKPAKLSTAALRGMLALEQAADQHFGSLDADERAAYLRAHPRSRYA